MARSKLMPATHWSTTPVARVLHPIQEFIHNSAAGGILLMIATILAMLVANSPLAGAYDDALHAYFTISLGPFEIRENVLHWINDGLMAIFFFLIGLEIKREVWVGELASPRAALLPIAAAIGGVAIPALIYAVLNIGRPGIGGWGIPMATDIAFALGLLALLGDRIPLGIKIFLTALAIVDDLMAVLVIAVFYSGGINVTALAVGLGVLGLLLLANLVGIRTVLVYVLLGLVVWVAFLKSGVHATIAGVLVALTVPARTRIDPASFIERAGSLLHRFQTSPQEPTLMLTNEVQQSAVIELEEACEDVQAPLQKLEHSLHGWVQFGIIPIFAFANAGVPLAGATIAGPTSMVVLGIILGLVVGKPVGIIGASWLAIRSGAASLPPGATWRHVIGAGFLAGIGFTMALFIGSLAFGESEFLDAAKLGILAASLIAGGIGFGLLRSSQRQPIDAHSEPIDSHMHALEQELS